MLSNDRLVSEDVAEIKKTMEANQNELADLREQIGAEEPDKTPR